MKAVQILFLCFILLSGIIQAQKRHGHPHRHHRHGKVVVVKRSPFRPKHVVVYHPVWHPKWSCNRRWVYFPKYKLYWDNWRNHYYFWNGTIWISQPNPPATVVNVNLAEEKHYELKEADDDDDDIGSSNNAHQSEYKPD